MKKEELLTLWKGKNWENSIGGIYFVSRKFESELHFNFTGYTEEDISSIPYCFMEKLANEINVLDQKVHQIVKDKCSHASTETLDLTDVQLDHNNCNSAVASEYQVGNAPDNQFSFYAKDDDVSKLKLTNVIFDISGCYNAFALGYYVGEFPAGELYFLVKFDDDFQPDSELIYEIY